MRSIVTSVLVGLLLIAGGAFAGSPAPEDTPLHMALLCKADHTGHVQCPESERLNAFQQWVNEGEALDRDASTFVIWAVGEDPQHIAPSLAFCVPADWGANVSGQQAAFLGAARAMVTSATPPPQNTLPKGCTPPRATHTGQHEVLVSSGLSPLSPAQWTKTFEQQRTRKVQVSVVCDLSGSTQACNAKAIVRVFDWWLSQGIFPGNTFRLYIPKATYEAKSFVFLALVPEGCSSAEQVAYLLAMRRRLDEKFAEVASQGAARASSAVLETSAVAAQELLEAPTADLWLVILSDLREIAATSTSPLASLNFESPTGIPSKQAFLNIVRSAHLFPDLSRLQVLACGLYDRTIGTLTPADVAKIAELWEAGFLENGVKPERLSIVKRCETAFPASR